MSAIKIRLSGNWKPPPDDASTTVDQVYCYPGGARKRAWGCFVYQANALGIVERHPIFDFSKPSAPPTALRGVTATHTSAEVAWTAPVTTDTLIGYRLVVTDTSVSPNKVVNYPATGLTQNLSMAVGALTLDHNYSFVVYSYTDFGIRSTPSNTILLNTGHPAVTKTRTAFNYRAAASRTDSWDKDRKWARRPGTVVQGQATSADVTNSWGVVDYGTVYDQIKASYGADVADHVDVHSVMIDVMWREPGGANAVDLYAYLGRATIGTGGQPAITGGRDTIRAPTPNANKVDIGIGVAWAREWAKKTPTWPCLVIHRLDNTGNNNVGFSGFCILEGKNNTHPNNWALILNISWNFVSTTLLEPKWT